jgi:hypothetical protein
MLASSTAKAAEPTIQEAAANAAKTPRHQMMLVMVALP